MSESQLSAFILQFADLITMVGLAGGITILMPVFVAIVNQSSWPRPAKEFMVIVGCLAGAIVAMLATHNGSLDTFWDNVPVMVPVMVYAARKIYHLYWKETGLAPWIEEITDFVKPQPKVDEVLDKEVVPSIPQGPTGPVQASFAAQERPNARPDREVIGA